jgi:3-dehydroquinate synthetase
LVAEFDVETIVFDEGEQQKNIHNCIRVWEELTHIGADRKSLIINLGGGVVTDLGGFISCTYKRGIEFIHIPTSLLAMVDASVGGKNGIDLGMIKNQVGTIRPAKMVVIDPVFLKTLPEDHMLSGFAEMLKHGLIHSDESWERLKDIDITEQDSIEELIWESVVIKDKIVSKDPFEDHIRKTLNYGHTLGHAIESYCLKNETRASLLHGEAVAIGLILATYLSNQLLDFPLKKMNDVSTSILNYFKKERFTEKEINSIIDLLVFDKKNRSGKILFVLLEDIGIFKTDQEVPNELIYRAFEYYQSL